MTQIDPLSDGMIGSSERGSSFRAMLKRPPFLTSPVGVVPVCCPSPSPSPPQAASQPGNATSAPAAPKRRIACLRVISSLTNRSTASRSPGSRPIGGWLLIASPFCSGSYASPGWGCCAEHDTNPQRGRVAECVRRLGPETDEIALGQAVHFRAKQKLEFAQEHVGDLLARMG